MLEAVNSSPSSPADENEGSYASSVPISGCWQVLSPIYFPMYFVGWWEYFVWC